MPILSKLHYFAKDCIQEIVEDSQLAITNYTTLCWSSALLARTTLMACSSSGTVHRQYLRYEVNHRHPEVPRVLKDRGRVEEEVHYGNVL